MLADELEVVCLERQPRALPIKDNWESAIRRKSEPSSFQSRPGHCAFLAIEIGPCAQTDQLYAGTERQQRKCALISRHCMLVVGVGGCSERATFSDLLCSLTPLATEGPLATRRRPDFIKRDMISIDVSAEIIRRNQVALE